MSSEAYEVQDLEEHPEYIPGETISIHANGPDAEVDFFIHVKKEEYILEIGDETKLVLPAQSLCSLGAALHDAHTELHADQVYEGNLDDGLPQPLAEAMAMKVRDMMKPDIDKPGSERSLVEFIDELLFK